MSTPTKSQAVAADVAALLRARNGLIWIVTKEEQRAEKYLALAARLRRWLHSPGTWDVADGIVELGGKPNDTAQDPGDALAAISDKAYNSKERGVWIMRDMHAWLSGPTGVATQRKLRNLARLLPGVPRESAQAVIVLTPSAEVPPELAGHATVIEWPLPDRAEIAEILDAAIESLPEQYKADAAPNGQRDAAIDAAVGLSGEEAQACYARSLVQHKRIDVATVAQGEKAHLSPESGRFGVVRPAPWRPRLGWRPRCSQAPGRKGRAAAFTPEARAYGLPTPKGVLLVGVPGCGKSLISKAIAAAWKIPCCGWIWARSKASTSDRSEENIRKAFQLPSRLCGRVVVLAR